jgi:glutaredoxin
MTIRLFIKPHCGWCHKAQHWLDQRGIKYETLDVISDSEAMKEMVELSGQTYAPVIDVDGVVLSDFGPEELEKFWTRISAAEGEHDKHP